jgi:hypothetical protein
MSELVVGSLKGLASNSYVIDVATGSTLDLSAGAVFPTGSILQVVQTVKTDTFSTTSTSYVDVTGMSASITPKSTSSKILVMTNLKVAVSSTRYAYISLLRNSTPIYTGTPAGVNRDSNAQSANMSAAVAQVLAANSTFLDSPATTSTVTYKVQMRVNSDTGFLNRSNTDTDATEFPRSASSIILMEVAG